MDDSDRMAKLYLLILIVMALLMCGCAAFIVLVVWPSTM